MVKYELERVSSLGYKLQRPIKAVSITSMRVKRNFSLIHRLRHSFDLEHLNIYKALFRKTNTLNKLVNCASLSAR